MAYSGPSLTRKARESKVGQAKAVAKLGFDQAVATVLLPLLLLPLVLIAVLIKLDSRGPVLSRQRCLGKDMRPFQRFKFRTMKSNDPAELLREIRQRVASGDVDLDGPSLPKLGRDPRVTRVGRVLRRLRIDGLPVVLNVLAGDMSLVGPRPAFESERKHVGTADRERFAVRPGIWERNGKGS